jgi:creatinine amidohydrolase
MTRLLDLSHARARALLASGAPVFLPVNPVEYHGPHLSLHNDALVSLGLAKGLHAAMCAGAGGAGGHDWPFLVASDLEVGVDASSGPGTRLTPYKRVQALVLEACQRLVELGAQRIVLMTFHGSPLHGLALDAAVRWLGKRGVPAIAPLNLLLATMRDYRPGDFDDVLLAVLREEDRAAILPEIGTDFHAGFFETSMALHYAPDSVDPLHRFLPPCPEVTPDAKLLAASRAAERLGRATLARELRLASMGIGWHALRPFPGYTSRPALATREAGAAFAQRIEREMGATAARVLLGQEPPPPPMMQWMARVTLGGALAPARPPLDAVTPFDALAPSEAPPPLASLD